MKMSNNCKLTIDNYESHSIRDGVEHTIFPGESVDKRKEEVATLLNKLNLKYFL